ncbi:O-antigen ligase family protein [filamentous cyanobacterium LEGE 11480]|uniref:O-antigen ligase family protein n=1 Tax=Romeriopsis navalis LEGE 11480 TaxID=2777977 RepID=A0A928Z1X8_9CYAN|nr:O-antigen ligase family protein [Romeriopsis navalis LEGE 11480]
MYKAALALIGSKLSRLFDHAWIRKALKFQAEDDLGEKNTIESVLYWTIVLTPLWWLLGIQTMLYPLMGVYWIIRGFNFDRIVRQRLPVTVWSWVAMTIVAFVLAMMAISDMGLPIGKMISAWVTLIKGYFLIFAYLTLPFWHRIRGEVIVRAVCWMAFGYVVTVAIQVALMYAGVWNEPLFPPLAKVIPGNKLSLMVKPAVMQPFFGIPLPRTSIYMADPPIPGVCGLLCYFMCLNERNQRLRWLGTLGSLGAVIVSQSRLAWVCFPASALVVGFLRYFVIRQTALWSMTSISFTSAMLGMTIKEMISKPMEVFTSARAESSADRALVVGKTIEAWHRSPWFGWGITRGSVKWHVYDIALGSFSSYASVLYHQGIFGFAFFGFALAATFWNMLRLSLRGCLPAMRAVGCLASLYLLLEGLPLTWITVYFWFFWAWLGTILAENADERTIVPEWSHLAPRP